MVGPDARIMAMSTIAAATCSFSLPANPGRHSTRAPRLLLRPAYRRSLLAASPPPASRLRLRPRTSVSASPAAAERDYEFTDGNGEVELRLDIGKLGIESSRDVFVDVDDMSLLIRAKSDGTLRTLMNVTTLFDRVKSSETIWFIDEDQLVVNLKKVEQELKWPDIDESWESLTSGITQLLTGISVHIVGDSTDINEAVAKEIAEGIGYLPVCTSELLESATQKSIDAWADTEGVDSVAEAECVVLESLSSHVRTVVATLGGKQGAASRFDKWQYLHSGFTVWLSVSDAGDEAAAKEEARRSVSAGSVAYAKSDVVVKLGGWDPVYTRAVAQGCLVALKQLTLADKKLAATSILVVQNSDEYLETEGVDLAHHGVYLDETCLE
ncbi:probable inactive shikimate kinase like 2, chloroplastic isoform X2 [Brachypodium distachyon]|uniref:probable inactive shikimate kinase like 2, chloroplastic isoform X2 n=1 Tax=Brachypodium distachyon TaxID=15368 RepID=UPI000D0D9F05|nr:probable inactive shikimate kinase like 2, chloroplastic isoform X2 [Brachypodium distachyon]|eukprot:XP_024316793.1 probable inactive shikimate kinase like 2, chloroplastic isoform X2 [Brachypodium distachyon]